MDNLTQRWTQLGLFSPKSGNFFLLFSKRAGEASFLLPSCTPMSVAEYVSVFLNMPKYLLKCFSKLSDHARALNIHDHLTCSTSF